MTTQPGIRKIEIIGQDDESIIVYPKDKANRGVHLAEGQVAGLWETREKQTWKSGARTKGSKPKNRKFLAQDMELGFHVIDTPGHQYEENESYLIQAIGFELDKYDDDAKYAKIAVHTDLSGVRYRDIVQYEERQFTPKQDPIMQQHGNTILKLRSGQPDWYELNDKGQPFQVRGYNFTSDGWGEVEVSNPTNREMVVNWVCTGPAAGEDGVLYTLPDFSWRGKKGARAPGGADEGRFLPSPAITYAHGGLVITVGDPDELPVRDFHGTNIIALFGGKHFMYKIPPYTQPQMLPIHAANVPSAGCRVELRQSRFWQQPWGGHLVS